MKTKSNKGRKRIGQTISITLTDEQKAWVDILKDSKEVSRQVYNQILRQVWSRVWLQVWDQVDKQVKNQVDRQVKNQVLDDLYEN